MKIIINVKKKDEAFLKAIAKDHTSKMTISALYDKALGVYLANFVDLRPYKHLVK